MLLIFPPVAKPCEPPAGIAKLAGALRSRGIECRLLDMNLEGLLYLLGQPVSAPDTWTRRAVKNIAANRAALRAAPTYLSFDRYSRAVMDVNRVLEMSAHDAGITAGLADYHDLNLSPLRSSDLITAADHPDRNPFYPYFRDRLTKILEEPGLPSIGFSLNYLSQALTTFAMIGFLKKEFPGVKIIVGGGLISSWMKGPGWKNPFDGIVDHCIAGPGEGALLNLLGVDDVQHNRVSPDYDFLPLRQYLSPGFILPYSASSGCYWNKCSFCPETAEANPYIPVPSEHAVSDLARLITKTEPALVHLLDNAVSPALMRALASSPPGIPWYGFARIGEELADSSFCRQLKQAGCVMLKLGLESGDQGVLDRLHKGIELETASRALTNLQHVGIAAYVYLLFGTPAETLAEARKTLDFVVRHREAITFLNLAVFNMPVCAREAGDYETSAFYEGDLSLYSDFRHPGGWGRREVRQFLDTEVRRHKAVAPILRRDPPLFTSNHAAFFRKP
jgi:radical SAM superfamily enzyme YgiQ (UPF0313 family)